MKMQHWGKITLKITIKINSVYIWNIHSLVGSSYHFKFTLKQIPRDAKKIFQLLGTSIFFPCRSAKLNLGKLINNSPPSWINAPTQPDSAYNAEPG